jgi:6-phosphogluconolactonase
MSTVPAEYWAYAGTYQPEGEDGIFHLRCDARTGRLTVRGAVSGVACPSFLALHPSGRTLYAASEAPGGRDGEVWAFAIDPRTGGLSPLNRRPAHGRSTCHVSVDPSGRWVLAANYGSPTVVMYPVLPGGALGEAAVVLRHQGSSVHPRQAGPHPHSVNVHPAGRLVYCADLGLDKVMIYRLDPEAGTLTPADPAFARAAPGAGPRHLAFHPSQPYAYLVNEIDCTVVAYAQASGGGLREIQTVRTVPAGFTGENTCADIHVHPSGGLLYASNRGHDSVAIFRLDPSSGRLDPLGHEPTRGRTPRNIALDPAGTFLFAENQGSDTIVTFRVDRQGGGLQATGDVLRMPTPVCLKFLAAPA